ncbi:class I SAM-dependent methyltransferase [Cohnella boryungensis]|uniref:Class I SAM-dependent methyltransferase n=1 Tax=Cohnella boryungensis TaxID=768479 RepID=A0ABV8SF30_9BACL
MELSRQGETPLAAIMRACISRSDRKGLTVDGEVLSAISFHQYMTLCLYHPEFGYYRSGASKVGREGDFYTSAFVGDMMGERLAAALAELAYARFGGDQDVEVIDWGGGTGRLAQHMLSAWHPQEGSELDSPEIELGGNSFSVTVIEANPEHRRQAEERLRSFIQSGMARVADDAGWEALLPSDRPVIVVANELLDAFPVHRLVKQNGRLQEWGVACPDGQNLISCLLEVEDPRLTQWLEEEGLNDLPDGQTVEANLDGVDWATKLISRLRRAIVVLIDYGDVTEELTASHRKDGTLLCYREHRAHNDPFLWPGLQDITAHVNFSHVRRSLEAQGGELIWYGTQKRFLVESGILERLSEHGIADPFHPLVRRNRAIRQLLLSDGMSELFKVQIFGVGG